MLSDPHASEIIVFKSFFYREFGLPAHPFLCDLLRYYGITKFHLTPNSILHIAIFINLCEAFLGIEPHFNVFFHFFYPKPFFGSRAPKIVDNVYLVLRDGMADQNKTVPLNSSVKGYNARWFYTKNVEESISANIDSMAKLNANWAAMPSSKEMH